MIRNHFFAGRPVMITLCLLFLFTLHYESSGQTLTVTPAKAYDYVDGIGVCIHIPFTGTVYDTGFESVVYPRLRDLGIRHVRDGIPYNGFLNVNDTLKVRTRYLKLYDSLGIKFCYCMASRKVIDSTSLKDSANYLSVFQTYPRLCQSIQYLEGFNEPDLTIFGWSPANWDTLTYAIQKGMWNKAHNMPELSGVKLVSTSLVSYWSIPSRPNKVAAMTPHISNYFDFANFHTYDGGNVSTKLFPGYYYDATKPALDTIRHGKPWVITEMGYENARYWNLPDSPGYNPSTYHYLSELAAGKYYSVLFMEMFSRGAKKVYGYEFVDQKTSNQTNDEMNFGLVHTDGTIKPAFTAIRNTLSILNDDSTSFTLSPLTFTLSGDVSGIKNALYLKTNGHYYLALWQGITKGVCYDAPNYADLPADSQSVKIILPFVSQEVKVYQPLVSGAPVYTYANKDTIQVQVPDHLLLIEVAPASSGSSSAIAGPLLSGASMKVVSPLASSGIHVTLSSKENQKGVLSVYNSGGTRLGNYAITVAAGNNSYDLPCGLASGIYVAVFRSDKGYLSQKFFR